MANCAPAAGTGSRHAWERWAGGLVGVYVALIVAATAVVAGDVHTTERRGIAIGLGAAWVVLLVECFRRMGARPRAARWPGSLPYLVPMLAIWAGLLGLSPGGYVATSVIFGVAWPLTGVGVAIGFVSAASVLAVVTELVHEQRFEAGVVLSWTLTLLVSALLGLWISGIISQSRERARLLAELESTQGELAASEREAGMLAERQRLAAEIHDTLAQGFASVVLQLEAAKGALPEGAVDAHRHLELARRTATENLDEARGLVGALTPPALAGGSLPDALDRLVGQTGETAGLSAAFTAVGPPAPLPPADEVTLLRVAQEAMTNVRRHAGANRVSVTLSYLPGLVELGVRDDGVGFDPGARPLAGFGLAGMRHRVAQQAGELLVDSVPGAGTTLTVRMPR